jgi:hypothetical protein
MGKAAARPFGHLGFHRVDIVAPKTDHARLARPGGHRHQALLTLRTTAYIHRLNPSVHLVPPGDPRVSLWKRSENRSGRRRRAGTLSWHSALKRIT